MGTTTKRMKTIGYRFVRLDGDDREFETLLKAALRKLRTADSRFYHPSNDERMVRFINGSHMTRGALCGDYLAYEHGAAAQLVRIAAGADTLPVASYESPSGNEFVGGMLLWAVAGNHMVVMQSATVRSGDFERYLNWLLGHAGLMVDGASLALEHRMTKAALSIVQRNPVRDIKLKLPLFAAHRSPSANPKREEISFERTVAADMLSQLLGPNELRRMGIEKAAAANLRLDIRVHYDRTTDAAGEAVLRRLASVLSRGDNIGEDNLEIEIAGVGRVIKGDELRLETSIPVQHRDGNPMIHDAFQEMVSYLQQLVESEFLG